MRMKGITCCGDCGYYNWKKHKCTRATNKGDAKDPFYADCPLPDVVIVQQPRVMTLDEVIQWEGAFWLEYIEEDSDYLCCWGYAFFSCASQNVIEIIARDGYRPLYSFIRSEYGVRWRCWTSRPTSEQMKAVKWDG